MTEHILNHTNTPIQLEKYTRWATCPTCKEGVLVGRRDLTTFEFLSEDNCLLCGQPVIYRTIPKGY